MQKWEYLQIRLFMSTDKIIEVFVNGKSAFGRIKWTNAELWEYINKLGQDGWEMVDSMTFKRPIE